MGLVSGSTGLYWSAEVQLALQNCLSESEHHVLTQEEAEEEAVSCFVGEFEYKWQLKLWYVYSNFLLMLLTDAVIVL